MNAFILLNVPAFSKKLQKPDKYADLRLMPGLSKKFKPIKMKKIELLARENFKI